MNLTSRLKSYFNDLEFAINIYKNRIHIINYENIIHFDSNKILVKCPINTVSINGVNLSVVKLMDNEILINGTIKELELK